MSVMTPYRSELRVRHDGFAQLLRAEWTKFRTVRGWVIGMVVALLVIVGLGALTGANSECGIQLGPNSPTLACPAPATGPGGEWVTDSFYFVRQPMAGNGSITVRVTSLTGLYSTSGGFASDQNPTAGMTPGVQPWSKAGIIVKASTRQGAAYAALMVTGGHGVRMQWDFTHDVAGLAGKVSAASPRWLRLTRSGDTITGYDSADGAHWTRVGAATLAGLPSTTQSGLFAASPGYSVNTTSLGGGSSKGGPTLATGAFDQVSQQGTWPAGRWTGQDIQRMTDDALPASAQGFTQAGGRFTVTGSGDIAPDTSDVDIIKKTLAGTFAGLIAVVVIGVMFITAEYRRGLIRTTLTASPRRGRVLAAKAIVLAAVAFAAGLVAAAVTIPLGEHLLHESGSPIPPVTAFTWLQVVAGTAGLLAVSAVWPWPWARCCAAAPGPSRGDRRDRAAVPARDGPRHPAGRRRAVAAPRHPGRRVRRPGDPHAVPPGEHRLHPGTGYFPLSPWAGFAVLCAWAAAALALALFLLRRRDA